MLFALRHAVSAMCPRVPIPRLSRRELVSTAVIVTPQRCLRSPRDCPPFLAHTAARFMCAQTTPDVRVTEITDDGIAVVTIDCQGEKMNTLNTRMNSAFEDVLGELQSNSKIRAAVLISGKPGVFVAGADIQMLVRPGHCVGPVPHWT